MDIEFIRRHCLSLPHTTEQIQWGYDLVFKIAGKMYAVTPTEPAPVWLSFKCSPDDFAELTERQGIRPAPYMARAQWVALEAADTLTPEELRLYLRRSYDLVVAKLPKKVQATLKKPLDKRANKRRN